MNRNLAALLLPLALALPCTARADVMIEATVTTLSLGGITNNFTITNSPTSGGNITSVTIDVSTAANPAFFDTAGFPFTFFPFTPLFGTEVTTGLTSPATVPDGATSVTLLFDDFNPGESFNFQIDVDGTEPPGGGIFSQEALERALQTSDELLGTTISATFGDFPIASSGQVTTLSGTLSDPVLDGVDLLAVGTLQGSALVPEPTSIAVWGLLGLVGAGYGCRRRFTRRRKN